jgi:hypothetical protein
MSTPGFTRTAQFEALRRIAAFSAALRGHELAAWREGADTATATCVSCGLTLTVYGSLIEPAMEGSALESQCGAERDKAA